MKIHDMRWWLGIRQGRRKQGGHEGHIPSRFCRYRKENRGRNKQNSISSVPHRFLDLPTPLKGFTSKCFASFA